ncbi:Iav (predicted) [Pycnogonum litorale]
MGNCCNREYGNGYDVVGSILDCAFSLYGTHNNDYVLYRIVNYQNGGLLLDAYRKDGMAEVERFLMDNIKDYSYNGDGKLTKREYSKWVRKQKREISFTVDNIMDNELVVEQCNTFQEHRACWKLSNRGMLGESLLEALLLCNTSVHSEIAKIAIRVLPELCVDFIEGAEYFGVSALHLSIIHNELDLLRRIIECGADVNQRATGRFFRPTDQQKTPCRSTTYEGLCYLGEYPLAWAACCGNEAAYNYLIDNGADPNKQDTYGNSVLHILVINNQQEMFAYAFRHSKVPADNNLMNDQGLTPLTLACKLGRNEIFRFMLELNAMEFWRYSNITCSGYPLNALDSLQADGKTNYNSALIIILSGKKKQHLDMLDGGVIQRLLEEKWKTFARMQFLKRFGLLLLHLITLTTAISLRPSINESLVGNFDTNTVVRYCAEIASCLGCLSYVFFEKGAEIRAQGIVTFFMKLKGSPPKTIFFISNLLVLFCIVARVLGNRHIEDVLISFALPGSWFFLMFFAGAVRLTGPFVTIIYRMLTGDMLQFGIILIIFLIGFSQAFFFLFKGYPREHELFDTYPNTWMGLFHMMLGEYEYADLDDTVYCVMTKLVFVIFMVLMPILLLNMLIAMMGNTYLQVITRSEKEWMKQWANIVLNLESALTQKAAKRIMQTYSIKMRGNVDGKDSDTDERAIMVIKSKSKSKSKQRRLALINWKKMGKRVMDEIRKCGGTAEMCLKKMNEAKRKNSKRRNSSRNNADQGTKSNDDVVDKIEQTVDRLAWTNDITLPQVLNSHLVSSTVSSSTSSDRECQLNPAGSHSSKWATPHHRLNFIAHDDSTTMLSNTHQPGTTGPFETNENNFDVESIDVNSTNVTSVREKAPRRSHNHKQDEVYLKAEPKRIRKLLRQSNKVGILPKSGSSEDSRCIKTISHQVSVGRVASKTVKCARNVDGIYDNT